MIQPFVKKFDKPQHSKIQVVEKTPSLRNLKTKYGQNRTKYGLFKGKTRPTAVTFLLLQYVVATTKGETGIGFPAKSGYWSRRTLLICVYLQLHLVRIREMSESWLVLPSYLPRLHLVRIREVSVLFAVPNPLRRCRTSCAYAKCHAACVLQLFMIMVLHLMRIREVSGYAFYVEHKRARSRNSRGYEKCQTLGLI